MYAMSTTSLLAFVIVDLAAIAGALFFTWRAMRRMARFVRLARRSSFSAALARGRHVAHRQAYRCAADVHYYLARLALMFCVNLLAVTGVIFATIGLLVRPGDEAIMAPATWSIVAAGSGFIFVAFMAWSVTRTVRLSRRVLGIRRNMRAVVARQRRTVTVGV